MKTISTILFLTLFGFTASFTAQAIENSVSAPTITYPDQATAMQALDRELGTQLAKDLIRKLASKNASQSLSIVDEFAQQLAQQPTQQPTLNIITLEHAYFKLAEHARIYQAAELDPVVLDFLIAYRSRAQVIHPESRGSSVPVFSIRATAAGARRLQQRESALLTATGLQNQPSALLQHYLSVTPVSQSALRDAAITLTPNLQKQLLALSLQQLKPNAKNNSNQTGLIDLLAALAFEQSDFSALTNIIKQARRQQLPSILKQISSTLPATEAKALLYEATLGDPATAAIAIHYLSQFSPTDNTVYIDMLKWLSEPELAAAAALALSSSQHKQVKTDLRRLSASSHAATARNAQLALDLLNESSTEGSL
ncbi:MAG: hypothetical protein L3J24_11780 [Xanthomonadales bacterium]|nr:hypothetical protein [Xanthomonadales bacterium]